MTTFQHKTLPITISYTEYSKLSASEKVNFSIVNTTTINNISNTTVSNKTEDILGIGKVAEIAVVTPIVIIGGILGLFD